MRPRGYRAGAFSCLRAGARAGQVFPVPTRPGYTPGWCFTNPLCYVSLMTNTAPGKPGGSALSIGDNMTHTTATLAGFIRTMSAVAAGYGESGPTADAAAEIFEEAQAVHAAGTTADGFNVWVSTFGLYNAGNLAGYWVAAESAPAEVPAFVAGLLLRGIRFAPADVGEEMHCFDTENAPESGEMSPGRAVELAEWIAELPEDEDTRAAFAAWIGNGNDFDGDAVESFTESYAGAFDSIEEYAGDYLEDAGMIAELPQWAQVYAGALVESFARDMRIGGDIWTADLSGGRVAIFNSY